MKLRHTKFGLLTAASALVFANVALADDMTFVGWGGQSSEAFHSAIVEPFTKASGIKVREDQYNGEVGPLKAQAESGNVTWDIVSTASSETDTLCSEGLLVELDYSKIAPKDSFFGPGAHRCGIADLTYGTLFAYDGAKVQKAPKSWKEFWDVKNFPGPRAMRNYVVGNLEFALMADGVKPDEVYKVLATEEGVDRAFKKLDEIKPSVKVWWTTGAQPPQLLVDGEVTYTTGYNNRFLAANKANKKDLKLVWDGAMLDYEYLVIVKGSKFEDEAMKLLAFASTPQVSAQLASTMLVGPAIKDAAKHIDPAIAGDLPSAHTEQTFTLDTKFWSENLQDLNARFVTWLSK